MGTIISQIKYYSLGPSGFAEVLRMAEEARAAEEAAEASKADPAKAAGLRRPHGLMITGSQG